MAHMVLDCPHCSSTRITFDLHASSPGSFPGIWNVFLDCRHCRRGIVVEMFDLKPAEDRSPAACPGDPRDESFGMGDIFPKSERAAAPEHVSPAIARDFEEAMDSLQRENHTAAGMMFRKVLQRATTALASDPALMKSKGLLQRIDMLAKDTRITEAMQEWAHIIRDEGNSAAHWEEEFGEAEFTKEDATELRHFTELFLIYTFTLPARVAAHAQGGKESGPQ